MFVKIVQPGWELFNDVLYGVKFEDGVSAHPLRRDQALQLGAMLAVQEVDEEGNELGPINPAHELIKGLTVSAEVVEPVKMGAPTADTATGDAITDDITNSGSVTKVYAAEELEVIAAEHGIGGLREIGDRLGVKNTSVKGLIREIMNAQNPGAQV